MTRILLADQHEEVLRALTSFLGEECGFTVVGTAREATSLLEAAGRDRPEVVLMEFGLPDRPAADLIKELHRLPSRPRVIAMGVRPEDGRLALRAGADGFASKTESGDWALDSLRQALGQEGSNEPKAE